MWNRARDAAVAHATYTYNLYTGVGGAHTRRLDLHRIMAAVEHEALGLPISMPRSQCSC
jgi:hypothetical protein